MVLSMNSNAPEALSVEHSCAVIAVALSAGRRENVRLVSGEQRSFGLNPGRTVVNVPYPAQYACWTRRTLACGVALQCSPSKDVIAQRSIEELTAKELRALTLVEGGVALGWVSVNWPGLLAECGRHLAGLDPNTSQIDAAAMLDQAMELADSGAALPVFPLLGRLPVRAVHTGPLATAHRMWGRMPWTSRRQDAYRIYSVPVGGDGGVKNPNLPPPSRPEDEEIEFSPDERAGVPYPEWNAWTERFLPNHVAVLERKHVHSSRLPSRPPADLRRFFEERTNRTMRNRLEDGCDLDIDRYIDHFIDTTCGHSSDGRVFRDLVPAYRDVTTCLLLDGSSSLGTHQGRIFHLELQCADALSQAMTAARERHGVFIFTGNTRHRVEVNCLKDFDDRRFIAPSTQGLRTAGYTRLGAPLRHLTNRLLGQPSRRRLLLVIGDGLMSDEGYEGRYAWADVNHAVEEAEDAGVFVFYIGVGPTRVDPLPEVFGPRRYCRIRRVQDLPRVLGQVHRELIAA
ncbi:nitric oxide reductase activation protein NorD [Mycobacterium sp. 94-17]|uniref:nitric oxide reductase activation protein NorD n=1 Tax=Mycobacterium sp. 94-17 TaxID=2986147 RepID=UPI002D1EEA89|nr:VWA domain-containing protein [Mycobacterium sp. 94-17]MEB4212164.1 VWA domain-containing protein [Mycobacterium sp. 94-17]